MSAEDVMEGMKLDLIALAKELKELTSAAQEAAIKYTVIAELMTQRYRPHDPNGKNGGWVRREVWKITNGKCFYCGHALADIGQEIGDIYREFHVDHIVAKANGGPDHISNFVPACCACNQAKSARHFADFFKEALNQ